MYLQITIIFVVVVCFYVLTRTMWIVTQADNLKKEYPSYRHLINDSSALWRFWIWNFKEFYSRDYETERNEERLEGENFEEDEIRPWD